MRPGARAGAGEHKSAQATDLRRRGPSREAGPGLRAESRVWEGAREGTGHIKGLLDTASQMKTRLGV